MTSKYGNRDKNLKSKLNSWLNIKSVLGKIMKRLILYQWWQVLYYFSRSPFPMKTGPKSQVNNNKLIIYQEGFRKHSDKILLYQWLQILYYFSRSHRPMETRQETSKNIKKGILYQESFPEDFNKILLYQWL